MNILYGFVLWERGDDRFSEYIAARIMVDRILNIKRRKSSDKSFSSTLAPLAYCYLAAYVVYVAYPLSDDDLAWLYTLAGAPDKITSEIFVADGGPLEKSGMYDHVNLDFALSELIVDIDALAKTNSMYSFVRTNIQAVQLYRYVVSNYSELMRLVGYLQTDPEVDFRSNVPNITPSALSGPAARKALVQAIRENGKKIIDAWESYLQLLAKDDFPEEGAKLNNIKGLWPIYARAQGAVALKDGDTNITIAPEAEGIHVKWLNDIARPAVYA